MILLCGIKRYLETDCFCFLGCLYSEDETLTLDRIPYVTARFAEYGFLMASIKLEFILCYFLGEYNGDWLQRPAWQWLYYD